MMNWTIQRYNKFYIPNKHLSNYNQDFYSILHTYSQHVLIHWNAINQIVIFPAIINQKRIVVVVQLSLKRRMPVMDLRYKRTVFIIVKNKKSK